MYRLIAKVLFLLSVVFFLFFTCFYILNPAHVILLLAFTSLAIALLFFLILRPPTIQDVCTDKRPCFLESAPEGDVWILSGNTKYLYWYNAVTKEIGPSRLVISISDEKERPRLLVIPEGTSISESDMDRLCKWNKQGTSLLCECPSNELTVLTGLSATGKGGMCAEEVFLGTTIDLTGATYIRYAPVDKTGENQEKIIFFERKRNEGVVFSLAVRYSNWAKDTCQGKPDKPDGRFSAKVGLDIQGMQTPDLRTDIDCSRQFIPVLDRFDQTLLGYICERLRIPRLWYYPERKACAYVQTFDEDWYGKRIMKLPDPGIPSTWFLVDDSPIEDREVQELIKKGGTCQFHWNRFILHLNKFGWHFCLRDVKEQVHNFAKRLSARPSVCRIHYLRWDSDFDHLFFVMRQAGLKIDSSFGPGRGQHGYRFGTGFPYWVGNKQGEFIGIREVPFQIHEPMGGASLQENLRLIDDAEREYHTAVVGLFHPYYCLPGRKSSRIYNGILEALKQKTNIWFTTIEGLTEYWEKRSRTGLTSVYEDDTLLINFSGQADRKMTLCFPDVQNIENIVVDDTEVPISEKLDVGENRKRIKIKYWSMN